MFDTQAVEAYIERLVGLNFDDEKFNDVIQRHQPRVEKYY